MVQFSKNLQKNAAIDLRRKGLSYSEIKKEILVPKSTLSHWFKKIKLSESQIQKLKDRRLKIAKANSEGRILKTLQKMEEIKNSSAGDLKKISRRELWLMGVVLYWRERFLHGNESDLRKGVRFTSSDPNIVKFFLKWLKDIGQLEKEEIGFDVFLINGKVAAEAINYWSQVTDLPKEYFSHVYFQKSRRKRSKRKSSKKAQHGLLRVRIKASSMLARQISGWIQAIVGQVSKL